MFYLKKNAGYAVNFQAIATQCKNIYIYTYKKKLIRKIYELLLRPDYICVSKFFCGGDE